MLAPYQQHKTQKVLCFFVFLCFMLILAPKQRPKISYPQPNIKKHYSNITAITKTLYLV